jgi:hypothetical protein
MPLRGVCQLNFWYLLFRVIFIRRKKFCDKIEPWQVDATTNIPETRKHPRVSLSPFKRSIEVTGLRSVNRFRIICTAKVGERFFPFQKRLALLQKLRLILARQLKDQSVCASCIKTAHVIRYSTFLAIP